MRPWRVTRALVGLTIAGAASATMAQAFDPETFKPSDALKEENSLRPPAKVGGANNAAVAYFEAWDMLKLRELQQLGALLTDLPSEGRIAPQLRRLLVEHRDYVDALLAASAMPECDWGPGWESGWELLLPHLRYLRTTARVLRADARRCGEDGSPIGAAERVKAMLRVSVHAADDPVLITSLVGISIGALAVQTTEELLAEDAVTPATARLLLTAFREVPRADLYGMKQALRREKQTTLEWLEQRCKGEGAGRKYVGLVRLMVNDPFTGALDPAGSMNEEQFYRDLQRAGRYYDEVLAAWNAPNAGVRLEELEEELREFQFGLIAMQMAPSVRRARQSAFDIERKFGKIEARLKEVGESEKPVGGSKEPEPAKQAPKKAG